MLEKYQHAWLILKLLLLNLKTSLGSSCLCKIKMWNAELPLLWLTYPSISFAFLPSNLLTPSCQQHIASSVFQALWMVMLHTYTPHFLLGSSSTQPFCSWFLGHYFLSNPFPSSLSVPFVLLVPRPAYQPPCFCFLCLPSPPPSIYSLASSLLSQMTFGHSYGSCIVNILLLLSCIVVQLQGS